MTLINPVEQGNGASSQPTPETGVLERAAERASEVTHHGLEAMRDSSRQLRDNALDASDRTVAYIKDEPVKAMLIAAASGAALMALITLISRSRHHG